MRIMSIPLAMAIMLSFLLPGQVALADNAGLDPNSITTDSYILIDADTGNVISEKSADSKQYPASTTKIMTALLWLEAKGGNLDEEITAGTEINYFSSTSTLMGLKQGETVSAKDILYGMMIPSGNDAANVVAATLTDDHEGYREKFAAMMNERAKELGMQNTHFENAHGLKIADEDHYTTARDFSKLAMEAMKNETFREVVKTNEYSFGPTNGRSEPHLMRNTNHLLDNEYNREKYPDMVLEGTIGIKTGLTTNPTNGCLVAAAERDGRTLIVVLMGDKSEKTDDEPTAHMRFYEAKKLLEFGFEAQGKDITSIIQGIQLRTTLTGDSQESTLAPVLNDGKVEYYGTDEDILAQMDASPSITYDISLAEGLEPPYTVGQEVGTVTYKMGGQDIFSCKVTVADTSLLPATTGGQGDDATGAPAPDGSTPSRVKNIGNNRNFMIAMLSVALIMLLVIFTRIMTAPRRRRRRRQLSRRRY